MAEKILKKGIFITFEGPEGCGKSTQSKLLFDFLKKAGYGCVHTREPGGTRAGELIRKIVLHPGKADISALAELFLFEAARAQLVQEVILPNLAKRKIIICDRFSDATVAYQGYGGKAAPVETIDKLNDIATAGLKPDLTILLDIDTGLGLKKAKKKGADRMEAKGLSYHLSVKRGYDKIAAREPARIKVVKVEKDKLITQQNIREIVLGVLERY